MNDDYDNWLPNPEPYIPESLSEIYDLLALMVLKAPTFVDKTGYFPEQDIHTVFIMLTGGIDKVRKKLGEERYAKLNDLAAQAKVLFADDPDDSNGKTDQGRDLLFEIEDLIQEVRSRRVAKKLKDDEGEVTGD